VVKFPPHLLYQQRNDPDICWVEGCVGVRGGLDPLPGIELLLVGRQTRDLTAVDTEQSLGINVVGCTQHSVIVHFRNAFHFSGDVLGLSNPSLETIRVAKKTACSDKTYRQNVQFI